MKINEVTEMSVGDLVMKIHKQCQIALSAYKTTHKIFLRGTRVKKGLWLKGASREYRKPRDSSEQLQYIFDEHMSMLGSQALRSNSIFVTSDKWQANEYAHGANSSGTIYAIFPIDGFNWLYTNESDLILSHGTGSIDIESWFDREKLDFLMRDVNRFFKQNQDVIAVAYQRMPEQLKEFVEVQPGAKGPIYEPWISGSSIVHSEMLVQRFLKLVGYKNYMHFSLDELITTESTEEYFGPVFDENLEMALQKQVETCIRGEYYAVDTTGKFFPRILEQLNVHVPPEVYTI